MIIYGLVGLESGIGNHYQTDHIEAHNDNDAKHTSNAQWKRILLLIVAITVHNIPGFAFKLFR